MKTAIILCLYSLLLAPMAIAQLGSGMPVPPRLNGGAAKLLGEHTAFTANLEIQTRGAKAEEHMTIPGRLSYLQGKSRFELETGTMKRGDVPPQMVDQMSKMGMDKMVIISLPDKRVNLLIYPGMKAYVETAVPEQTGKPEDYRVTNTDLGKEVVDGQSCIKSRAAIVDKQGNRQEAVVWYATALKRFPLRIETLDQGSAYTMTFRNVSLAKPAEAQFEAPAGFAKYTDVMSLLQDRMMKQRGGMGGARPEKPAPSVRPVQKRPVQKKQQ